MNDSVPDDPKPSSREPYALAISLLALTGFGFFVLFLLTRLGTTELSWTRAVYLLSGVEALAFSGAGFLFGREVQRRQVDGAETRAKRSEQRAEANEEAAVKGRALALMVVSTVTSDGREGTVATVQSDSLKTLADVAEDLFPEVALRSRLSREAERGV